MTADRVASPATHGVTRRLDVRIPVRDGTELSANLWLPDDIESGGRHPAILEMIPYRKDDWRANADEARGRYLAQRGYALCRLDVRGTGRSDGVAIDEYTADETRDGYDAVEWLAAQSWCTGRIGMWGISYGGFTAIQVAALRPPHLLAIVSMYATDDRYTDDVHYIGGCVTASELTQYAVSQVGTNALPALPARQGENWQAAWRERLEATPIWMVPWLANQADGPYWRQGSLAPGYDRIEAAILLFGGWMDSYVDPVLRMLDRCSSPRRAIIGNWVHTFPDEGYPTPNLDWLHELVRFFDFWLKEEQNGAMDEPALTWFQRDYAPAAPFPTAWPGRWRATQAYRRSEVRKANFWLSGSDLPLHGRLEPDPGSRRDSETFTHRATVGTSGGLSWGAGAAPNGLARDIRRDEVGVPVFTSRELEDALDVLGPAIAILEVSTSMEIATLVVRLSDVAPDGSSSQVTMGVLNLTHRHSHAQPEPMVTGRSETVRVPLRSAGYRFAPGHRIRLSVASSCWPVIWPSPQAGLLTIHHGPGGAAPAKGSRLELPLAPATDDAMVPSFRTELAGLEEVGGGSDDPPRWQVTEDVLAGTTTVSTHDGGETILEDGGRLYSAESHELVASDDTPAVASMSSVVRYVLERDGHRIEVDVDGTTSSDSGSFRMEMDLQVRLDGEAFFERRLDENIPRRLV